METDASALLGATLYLDCYAGIAGDMMLGALLDLGVPESVLRDAVARLPLSGYRLEVGRVLRGVLSGTKVRVVILEAEAHTHEPARRRIIFAPGHKPGGHQHAGHDTAHRHGHGHGEHQHPHVHYADIRRLIEGAGLDPDIVERALRIFDRLAEVEAAIHGVPVSDVSFHEVGATDSIIDIVGTAAALSWLRPRRVLSRRVPLGGGMVQTAHGRLPVPAPATLALLRGALVEPGGAEVELTTPTGAAILAATCTGYGPLPAMRVLGAGWGAGDRELPDRPNLLRIVAGTEDPAASEGPTEAAGCLVIEANLDDMNPELCEPLLLALFAAGARDAWFVPVHMKKNRPGFIAAALCDPGRRQAVTEALLRESTTLGVRTYAVAREVLERVQEEVATPYGAVLVKLGRRDGAVWNMAPEYESCRAAAAAAGVPVKQVYAAAIAAYGARAGGA